MALLATPGQARDQAFPGGFNVEHVGADEVLAEFTRGLSNGPHELAAGIDNVANALDAVCCAHPSQDVPIRIDRPSSGDIGVFHRNTQDINSHTGDLHAYFLVYGAPAVPLYMKNRRRQNISCSVFNTPSPA
jgi:hypothetical protein